MAELGSYIAHNWTTIIGLTVDHMKLYFITIIIATIVGLILGILTVKSDRFSFLVPIFNSLQSAPDLILLALALYFLGTGAVAALVAFFVKGILPILRNTYSSIISLDQNIIEAARGMGMSQQQILFKIELPIAMPVIIAGVRVASVIAISVLTLSAYIGVSSLGVLIAQGIATSNRPALIIGSALTALLAILMNYLLFMVEKQFSKRRSHD
ncbi:MAG: ABC transporter permease [Bacillota bacterium]|nr:ABC transporter permease [Bacillota bacterium]